MKNITSQSLRLLFYFHTVAGAGSITQAAGRLRVSAPVVSTALRELERNLGVTLLNRTTRKMQLTDIGRRVFQQAEQVVRGAEDALRLVDSARQQPRGELGITLAHELLDGWLAFRLVDFNRAYPGIGLRIHAEDALVPLGGSAFDIAVRTRFVRRARSLPGVVDVVPVCLVCAGSRVGTRAEWYDVLDEVPLIVANPAGKRHKVAGQRSADGKSKAVNVRNTVAVNAHPAAKVLCRHGLGVAMLLAPTVEQEIASGDLVDLGKGKWQFGFVEVRLVTRDRIPSPAAAAFLDFVSNTATGKSRTGR